LEKAMDFIGAPTPGILKEHSIFTTHTHTHHTSKQENKQTNKQTNKQRNNKKSEFG
jgi:hypothetical protein